MQDKEIEKIIRETIRLTKIEENSAEKTPYLIRITSSKGVHQVRIKTKIYEEIKFICDRDQISTTDYISSILAVHIFELKNKAKIKGDLQEAD